MPRVFLHNFNFDTDLLYLKRDPVVVPVLMPVDSSIHPGMLLELEESKDVQIDH